MIIFDALFDDFILRWCQLYVQALWQCSYEIFWDRRRFLRL